jgi:phosphonopyruvate decarboxylase
MISPSLLFNLLKNHGIVFYAGVPDSLLSDFSFVLESHRNEISHTISANEGLAVSLACGHHLATGKTPAVYLQNSGLGNMINPLVSLSHSSVYQIPMLLIIGWRGEPMKVDQPQHRKQGEITPSLLNSLDVPYSIVDADTDIKAVTSKTIADIQQLKKPHALLFKKKCFSQETLPFQEVQKTELNCRTAINQIISTAGKNSVFVTSTGHISRIMHESRAERGDSNGCDFLNVGAMGHTAQIALGIAMEKPEKKIYCLDGDGALLMHMGGLTTIGKKRPNNLVHILLNNGCHASVGGHPTVAFDLDLEKIVQGCGYPIAMKTTDEAGLIDSLKKIRNIDSLVFLEIIINTDVDDLPVRPEDSTLNRKENFMNYLSK